MRNSLPPTGRMLSLCAAASLFLGGCNVNQESQRVRDAVENVTYSASGAIETAKSGVQGAIDAGHMAAGSAKKLTDDVVDRVDKIRRGTELIKEGLGSEEEE